MAVLCRSILPPETQHISGDQATPVSSQVWQLLHLGKYFPLGLMTVFVRSKAAASREYTTLRAYVCIGWQWCATCGRPASSSTTSQPKSVSVAHDGTVFVAEISSVEVFRENQKVYELKPSYAPSTVGAGGSIVAIGEVGLFTIQGHGHLLTASFCRIRKFISTSGTDKHYEKSQFWQVTEVLLAR